MDINFNSTIRRATLCLPWSNCKVRSSTINQQFSIVEYARKKQFQLHQTPEQPPITRCMSVENVICLCIPLPCYYTVIIACVPMFHTVFIIYCSRPYALCTWFLHSIKFVMVGHCTCVRFRIAGILVHLHARCTPFKTALMTHFHFYFQFYYWKLDG